jgi:hypothetical protein
MLDETLPSGGAQPSAGAAAEPALLSTAGAEAADGSAQVR